MLNNKNVLVTGASSGIGAAIAEAFAKEGANVGIHYSINQEGAIRLTERLSTLTQAKIKTYQQDFLSDNLDLVQRFIQDFGRIDILVNNAGVTTPLSILDMSPQDYDQIFKINSRSAFILARDAFKHMKENGSGRIINISGAAVKYGRGRNNSIQYAATKATLNVLTTGLAIMGAPHNILVNSISPGVIMTRLHQDRPDLNQRVNLIPLKRPGRAEEIANMAVYLASEKGSFITGEVFGVTGGE